MGRTRGAANEIRMAATSDNVERAHTFLGHTFTAVEHVEQLTTCVAKFLCGEAPCQVDAADEEADDADPSVDGELDVMIVQEAIDLVAVMAEALAETFPPVFEALLPMILPHTQPASVVMLRSASVACLSEVPRVLGPAVAPFVDTLVPPLMAATADVEVEVASNSAYALGVLAEVGKEVVAQHAAAILHALAHNCIGRARESHHAVDNAVGAVCRMIMSIPASIPLAQVLPTLFGALPLKADFEENAVVFKCLEMILRHSFETAQPFLGQYLTVFCTAASAEQLGPETLAIIRPLLLWLSTTHAGPFAQALQSLPEGMAAYINGAAGLV